jgi:hypothetical protein
MNSLRKSLLVFALAPLLLVAGCDDKEARELAAELNTVTESYREQTVRTTNAEQKAYKRLAAAFVRAEREDITQSLTQEQIERAGVFADEVTHSRQSAPLLSDIHAQLRDFAELDFKNTQELLEDESVASTEYMAQLEKLNVNTKQVEALGKSFENLAKSKSKRQEVQEIVGFMKGTKSEIDKQFCRDLTRDIEALEAKIKTREGAPANETKEEAAARLASIPAMNSELEILKGQKDSKKCDKLLATQ